MLKFKKTLIDNKSLWLILCSILFLNCIKDVSRVQSLNIFVVGNAVPNTFELNLSYKPIREFSKDQAKGNAIWTATNLAYNSGAFRIDDSNIEIKLFGIDDFGDKEYAKEIGKALARKPGTLAVIGSTASSTSTSIAQYTDQYGIPFFMPIATSPLAVLNSQTGKRFKRVIRMAPSDDRVQAPAVVTFALKNLNSSRIAIVKDIDPGAETYSEPLVEKMASLLDVSSFDIFMLRSIDGASNIIQSIKGGQYDTIIYAGYVSGAIQILYSIREEFQNDEKARPRVIMTDGALDKRLIPGNTNSYIMFPLPPVESIEVVDSVSSKLVTMIKQRGVHSYEVYAFDATQMIGDALRKCKSNISRDCLYHRINEIAPYPGIVSNYTFIDGENTEAEYYVYKATSEDSTLNLSLYQILDSHDIISKVNK